jgi:hypothetical protein
VASGGTPPGCLNNFGEAARIAGDPRELLTSNPPHSVDHGAVYPLDDGHRLVQKFW